MRVDSVKLNNSYKQIHFGHNATDDAATTMVPVQGQDVTQFKSINTGEMSKPSRKLRKVLTDFFSSDSGLGKYDPRNSDKPGVRVFLF